MYTCEEGEGRGGGRPWILSQMITGILGTFYATLALLCGVKE